MNELKNDYYGTSILSQSVELFWVTVSKDFKYKILHGFERSGKEWN